MICSIRRTIFAIVDPESSVSTSNEFFSQTSFQSIPSLTDYWWQKSSSSRSTETRRSIQILRLFNLRRTNSFSSNSKSSMIDSIIRIINIMIPRLLNSHGSIKPLACWHGRWHSDFTRSPLFNTFFFLLFSLSIFVMRGCIVAVLDLSCISSF